MPDSDLPDSGLPETEEPNTPSAAEMEAAGQSALFGEAEVKPAAETPPDEGETLASAEPQSSAEDRQPQTGQKSQAEREPEQETQAKSQPYRVLARKYRPQTFSQLIGQEPMVRTLANAIARDRLAHAFLMTGVRGVGKTSTARLIAKALNCIGPDGAGGATIDPCGTCEPCQAIAEGRHIDVIEMDAASNTGVDDVREIIEAVRYAAVSARYKIYIIDEVHMLSRNAFNALLKTLEEPPAHVKFLFATTEVEKLPVTVLSRTQRFDLRRIPADMLEDHFAHICGLESVEAEREALHLIAAASEGSVRDGLSILDQAIAHAELDGEGSGSGVVKAARVREMLGLADKSAQRHLLGFLLEGDAKALLASINNQYELGVEPQALMRSVLDLVHAITVAQVGGDTPDAPTQEERDALSKWAGSLSAGQLHRLWQLLLKGYDEVRQAPDPLVSLQMALLRTLHASDMPDPGELAKKIEGLAQAGPAVGAATSEAGGTGGANAASDGGSGAAANSAVPAPAAIVWSDLVAQVDAAGQLRVAQIMHDWVRVIELEDARLVFALADGFSGDPSPEMRDALLQMTGTRWTLEKRDSGGKPALRELQDEAKAQAQANVRSHPLVKAALEVFPDAELIEDDNMASGDPAWGRRA